MFKATYSHAGSETEQTVLRITSIGYLLLLLSVGFSIIGVFTKSALFFLPGFTIQFSFIIFLWFSLAGEEPEFDLNVELPSTVVKAKQFLTLNVLMKSTSIDHVIVEIHGSSGIFPVLKPNKSILVPQKGLGSSFVLYTPRRGKEKVKSIELVYEGIPGLFYFTTSINVNIRIIVLPQPQRVQLPWTLKQRIFDQFISEISISRRGRGDEFLSLRDFQFGDELRNIHWKATAKWGRLISKEFEEPIQLRFLIVVDRSMLMAGPKFEFALSSIVELASVIRSSNHSCTILVHGNKSTWQHNLGTSPSSLNRLSILLHSVQSEGTHFNYVSLNDYIRNHRLTDTVLIILSDLEQRSEEVRRGISMIKGKVQRILYFACYSPGFSNIDFVSESDLIDLEQYYYRELVLKSHISLAYFDKEIEYKSIFNAKKSRFHLIKTYNTNILLELRDTLRLMQTTTRATALEGVV